MRILIVYRHFWPDTTPYAALLEEMIPWFVAAGHEVEIFTAQPSYARNAAELRRDKQETVFGAKVYRLPLPAEKRGGIIRALNNILFSLAAFLRVLFGRKADLYWSGTTPPVVQSWLVSLAAKIRGGKFLYQMQDIYPEIGIVSKIIGDGAFAKLMRWLDGNTLNRTDAAVVLSEDMATVIRERGVKPTRLSVINNFALGVGDPKSATAPNKSEPIRFAFAGNIGRFQNLDALIDAFAGVDPKDAVLEMLGDGVAADGLKKRVADEGLDHIRFHGHMSVGDAFDFMTGCHVGIVPLAPDLYRYAYPAKTHSYMAAGLRILALLEPHSRLASSIEKAGVGHAVGWDEGAEGLRKAIAELAADVRGGKPLPETSREIYHPDAAKARWDALLADIAGDIR